MANESQRDLVAEARELLSSIDVSLRTGYALKLLRQLADEVERLRKQIKTMQRDAREDALDAATEARWQERQGEDYGSY